MSTISSATDVAAVNHDAHIVCCTKQPGFQFQKAGNLFNGAAGLGLLTWGMAELIKGLMVTALVGSAAWFGAGIVLVALVMIAWIAYTYVQHKSIENKENSYNELKARIDLLPKEDTTAAKVAHAAFDY